MESVLSKGNVYQKAQTHMRTQLVFGNSKSAQSQGMHWGPVLCKDENRESGSSQVSKESRHSSNMFTLKAGGGCWTIWKERSNMIKSACWKISHDYRWGDNLKGGKPKVRKPVRGYFINPSQGHIWETLGR